MPWHHREHMANTIRALPKLYSDEEDALFDEEDVFGNEVTEPMRPFESAVAEVRSYVRELAPVDQRQVSELRAVFDSIVDELERAFGGEDAP